VSRKNYIKRIRGVCTNDAPRVADDRNVLGHIMYTASGGGGGVSSSGFCRKPTTAITTEMTGEDRRARVCVCVNTVVLYIRYYDVKTRGF